MERVDRLTYSVEEAATALGISRAKTYELVNSDGFPVVRVGRRIRIPITALEDWVLVQSQEKRKASGQ